MQKRKGGCGYAVRLSGKEAQSETKCKSDKVEKWGRDSASIGLGREPDVVSAGAERCV